MRLDRVALLAIGPAAVVACHAAAQSPNRVTSVVFIEGGASEANRRVLSLRHVNPHVEARVRGALVGGLEDRHASESLAAVAREALEPAALQYWEDVLDGSNLPGIAARVAAPALYVDVADDEVIPRSVGQALVEVMAHGELITVPGRSPMDVWRDRAGVQRIARFIARHFGVETDLVRTQRRARKGQPEHHVTPSAQHLRQDGHGEPQGSRVVCPPAGTHRDRPAGAGD